MWAEKKRFLDEIQTFNDFKLSCTILRKQDALKAFVRPNCIAKTVKQIRGDDDDDHDDDDDNDDDDDDDEKLYVYASKTSNW